MPIAYYFRYKLTNCNKRVCDCDISIIIYKMIHSKYLTSNHVIITPKH